MWPSSALLAILPLALAAETHVHVQRSEPAPLFRPGPEANATVIPGKYIIKLRDQVSISSISSAGGIMSTMSSKAEHVYQNDVFKGFAGALDDKALKALRMHNDVEYIEQDTMVTISNACEFQKNAPWGLARLSNKRRGLLSYFFNTGAGAGTCIYVIDTGVDDKHPEFQGRAKQIKSFVPGQTIDNQGHGTHCAGTIASRAYGVAKKARVFGVKVLDGSGSGPTSAIIAGMQFVQQDMKKQNCPKGVMVNLSLAGSYSRAENEAARALVNSGAFVAVAAGNDGRDASLVSPASEPSVCTVGAIDRNDNMASFSNFGKSLAVFAPGVDVISTIPGGRTAALSGTSMASPHVAGLAAYIASKEGIKGRKLCERIKALSQKSIVKSIRPGSPNRLAYNGGPAGCGRK